MKYQIPKISKEEILVIEIDNTKGNIDAEKAKDFFNKNIICNLTKFECHYEIKLKTAIRAPSCSIECACNPKELKIPNYLDQIVVFKNTYLG